MEESEDHDEGLLSEARGQQTDDAVPERTVKAEWTASAAFFMLGILNNVIFCVILAGAVFSQSRQSRAWLIVYCSGAKDIDQGGVGAVFLAMQLPALLIKVTGPTWYHLVSYTFRVHLLVLLCAAGLLLVALSPGLQNQLIGVALTSVQIALGEASMLSLTSRFQDSRTTVTAWSSGTGFAGLLGFGWVLILEAVQLPFTFILVLSLVFPLIYVVVFHTMLRPALEAEKRSLYSTIAQNLGEEPTSELNMPILSEAQDQSSSPDLSAVDMTFWQRVSYVCSLWRFKVPLMLVYLAEYVMQSGTWSAIGFPLDDEAARNNFYRLANLCYQVGVCISRSSGLLCVVSMPMLWLLPFLQVALLVFFCMDCLLKFWYNWTLLAPCVVAGLLGGTVYVQGFSLLSTQAENGRKELAMGSVAMAADIGVATADFMGILVQGCIYRYHNLPGAVYECKIMANTTAFRMS